MADQIPISELPPIIAAQGGDAFPVVQDGITYKETVDQAISKNNSIIGLAETTASTDGVINQDGSSLLHTLGGNNVFLGGGAGNFTFTNCFRNTGLGASALNDLTTGANDNTVVGWASASLTTGSQNTLIGSAVTGVTTGSRNLLMGFAAGSSYTGAESNNICLGTDGVDGESGISRLGDPGLITDTYIAGLVHGNFDMASAFSFVVGATGNYPATLTGLQDALNDANGTQPVFVQEPGVTNPGGDGTPIIMPDGTLIVGAYNEMPVNALLISNGSYTSNRDPVSFAKTIIDANLVPVDSTSGTYSFYNICLAPQSWNGLTVPEGVSGSAYNFKNSWVCSGSGQPMINSGGRTTGNGSLNLNLSNSLLNNSDGTRLIDLAAGGSSISVGVNLSDNSVFFGDVTGSIDGPNIGYFLTANSGSSYINSVVIANTTGCTLLYQLLNCRLGTADGDPFVLSADNTFSNITLSQQNVNYLADNAGGGASLFQNIGGITLQYTGSGSFSQGITLENFNDFCNDSTINQEIVDSCSGLTINGKTSSPVGSFNIINTNPSPSTLYTASMQTNIGGTSFPLGTPVQNTLGVDVSLIVGFTVTAATTATLKVGTGQSSTPTTDTLLPSFSIPGIYTLTVPWPTNHYLLIESTGVLTSTNNFIVCGL